MPSLGKNNNYLQHLANRLITSVVTNRKSEFDSIIEQQEAKNIINLRSDINGSQVTALDMAANIGHDYFAKKLIENGADVKGADGDSNTALHWASLNGKTQVVQTLLENGANITKNCVDTTPMHDAAKGGHTETMKLLASKFPDEIDTPNGYGNTPLMRAAMHSKIDVAKYILEEHKDNIDINHQNKNGFTALDIAEGLGNDKTTELLKKYDATHSKGWEKKKNLVTRNVLLEKSSWEDFLKDRKNQTSLSI